VTPLETVLERLTQAGLEPVATGSGYQAKCPGHDDDRPSLSMTAAPDCKVLLKCHAGCKTQAIVEALGLQMRDLFPPRQTKSRKAGRVFKTLDEAVDASRRTASRAMRQQLVEASRYTYTDANGADALVVVRFEPDPRDGSKTCRPFHPVQDGWHCGDPSGPLPLYHLPQVTAASGTIMVVEGEPCADAAADLGFVATTSAHGANSATKTDWSPLAGREVVILPDNDDAGRKYAADLAQIITRLGPPAKVKLVALPGLTELGDDIVDFCDLHRDKSKDDIRRLIEDAIATAPEWVDDTPQAEILDVAPDTILRPLNIVRDRGYLASWVYVRAGGEDSLKRVVLRDDGILFGDPPVPGAQPFGELGLAVDLAHVPHLDTVMSGAALKRYAGGERPSPAEVVERVRTVVDHFMDFAHSVGSQSDLVDLVALYILMGYLLDAFSVVGYLWPNGDKGAGKTKLLVVVTSMSCMGMLVTAGGTFASLRDLADYGASIGFDDSESIMDVRRADPDKRTLLLAGNRRGAFITLKEPVGENGWTIRYVHAFCPRLFSAINLPDETLASRTIVVPLVRSADEAKANRDPADHEAWPVDRRRLIDDLWALGLANLTAVRAYDRRIPQRVGLVGRVLEPWRALLAVALWLQEEHRVGGIFDRMTALAAHYQEERSDIEEASPVRVLIVALRRMLATAASGSVEFTATDVSTAMNQIAAEDDIDHPGDTFTSARKVGRLLQRLRIQHLPRTAGTRRCRATVGDLDSLARAYGMAGVRAGDDVSDVSDIGDVSRGTPSDTVSNVTTAPTCAPAGNDLDWGVA
jgi:hypothetical protein